jgi:hypothetical protein
VREKNSKRVALRIRIEIPISEKLEICKWKYCAISGELEDDV